MSHSGQKPTEVPARILVARTDRLGDVMMALPSLEYLREALPDAEIDFLCREEYIELLDPHLASRHIRAVGWKAGAFASFDELLAKRGYLAALMLHDDPSLLWRVWRGRVPLRVGPYSKPVSFLFLNRGIRQRRSQASKNEGEYNLDLAKHLAARLKGSPTAVAIAKVELAGDESSRQQAQEALDRVGLGGKTTFIVVHPGTGGSATHFGPERYIELIDFVGKTLPWPVVLTQGPSPLDRDAVAAIRRVRTDIRVLADLKLPVLREVLRRARVVIAPSTGPLHVAHYVGTATLGVYSPIRSQRKERWEPWGGTGTGTILEPKVNCRATRQCLGPACEDYFCMDRMTWDSLILPSGNDLKDSH